MSAYIRLILDPLGLNIKIWQKLFGLVGFKNHWLDFVFKNILFKKTMRILKGHLIPEQIYGVCIERSGNSDIKDLFWTTNIMHEFLKVETVK